MMSKRTPIIINWFSDIRATHHSTPEFQNLEVFNEYKCKDQLKVGNGNG